MKIGYKLRRSSLGKSIRQLHHSLFRLRHSANKPVSYQLPSGVTIQLYPEGEITAFLALQSAFELTELALVAAYLQPGMNVLDVGANVGLYSILAQKKIGPTGKVWAFEPSLESFGRLQRNLQLNGCESVAPVRFALTDRDSGALHLASDEGFGDAYRYLKQAPQDGPSLAPNSDDPSSEMVPVTTLDQWASENKLPALHFLKVDVEGGEYRVFAGARHTLRSSREIVILFESDPHWSARSGFKQVQIFDLLRDLGLDLYAWNGKTHAWQTDQSFLLENEMIWACFDQARLPRL